MLDIVSLIAFSSGLGLILLCAWTQKRPWAIAVTGAFSAFVLVWFFMDMVVPFGLMDPLFWMILMLIAGWGLWALAEFQLKDECIDNPELEECEV